MAKLIEDPDGQVDPNHTVVLVLTEYELLTIASLVGHVSSRKNDAHHGTVRDIWRAIMYKNDTLNDVREPWWDKVQGEHVLDIGEPLKFKGEYE